jgi:Uma2 family endonuclease
MILVETTKPTAGRPIELLVDVHADAASPASFRQAPRDGWPAHAEVVEARGGATLWCAHMALSFEQPGSGTVAPLSRREFDELTRRGVLDDARVELLCGRVVSMSPQGGPHSYGVTELARALIPAVGRKGRVRIQMPLAVSDSSEPEPDIAIVPPGDYLEEHPTGAWLVIEVADSSLDRDRTKAKVYAAAGVVEYWIVNLVEGVFEVHAGPSAEGYARVARHGRGATLRVPQLAEIEVAVSDVLPPQR